MHSHRQFTPSTQLLNLHHVINKHIFRSNQENASRPRISGLKTPKTKYRQKKVLSVLSLTEERINKTQIYRKHYNVLIQYRISSQAERSDRIGIVNHRNHTGIDLNFSAFIKREITNTIQGRKKNTLFPFGSVSAETIF